LRRAEDILPTLEADIEEVERIVTVHVGGPVPAEVIGIRIEADGSASYDCTFFDGEHEDELTSVNRDVKGHLAICRP
jgi:hypothetical protein